MTAQTPWVLGHTTHYSASNTVPHVDEEEEGRSNHTEAIHVHVVCDLASASCAVLERNVARSPQAVATINSADNDTLLKQIYWS